MTIGQQIRTARKGKGMRQHTVAESLGVTVQAVSQWERDKTLPGQLNLMRLAALLDFRVDGLEVIRHMPLIAKPANYAPLISPAATLFYNRQDDEDIKFSSATDDYVEMAPESSELVPFTWTPVGSVYALRVSDTSMAPDFLSGDIVIVDAEYAPSPGDFVVAEHYPSQGGLIRRYRLKGKDDGDHAIVDLVPSNADYPVTTIAVGKTGGISGCVREFRRVLHVK